MTASGLPGRLRLDLTVHNEAQGHYDARTTLWVDFRTGESARHVLLKFLAYVLFYEPDLVVEPKWAGAYRPDLVAVDQGGAVRRWIECGAVKPRKLLDLLDRHAQAAVEVVKPHPDEMRAYVRHGLGVAPSAERLTFYAPQRGFVRALTEIVQDHARVQATVVGARDHVFLVWPRGSIDTSIEQCRPVHSGR